MRVYTGNQYQDNALLKTGSMNPTVTTTGQYCTITAGNTQGNSPVIFGVTPQPYFSTWSFVSTNFYIFGNTGVTGGTIQPQIQLADGVYRDYGPLVTVTAAGFIYAVTINASVLGAQFNVTGAITGGSVYLEIDCLQG